MSFYFAIVTHSSSKAWVDVPWKIDSELRLDCKATSKLDESPHRSTCQALVLVRCRVNGFHGPRNVLSRKSVSIDQAAHATDLSIATYQVCVLDSRLCAFTSIFQAFHKLFEKDGGGG
jgi:hypothetical protein